MAINSLGEITGKITSLTVTDPEGRSCTVTGPRAERARTVELTAEKLIDQLGKTGDFHAVRIAQEGDQHGAHQQRILKVVNILQQRQRSSPLAALPDLLILLVGMIPDVPFVKGEIHGLF